MRRDLRSGASLALTLFTVAFLASCGNVGSAPINNLNTISGVSVLITPSSITVGTSTVTPFTATVNGSGVQAVQWQVNGIPGGAAAIGTIDSSGNYTAPRFVPNPANVMITAIANADNTKSGNASVSITGTLLPALVYMSPTGTAYVQTGTPLQLSSGITGPADTSVVWQVNGITNGNSTLGTIVPGSNGSAVYNAPARLPNPSSVTIKAVSHSEPTRFNSCTVALSTTPPKIATVTISPVLAIVQSESNSTFTASVINASEPSVSWEVGNSVGGDQTYGTIASEGEDTGVYTGPPQVPLIGNPPTIRAFSNAQPTRSSTGAVLISPPPTNGVVVQVKGGTTLPTDTSEQITAVVSPVSPNGIVTNPNVTWEVNGIAGGNATVGTIQVVQGSGGNTINYFSPASIPAQNTVVVEAISEENPKVVGTLPIQITKTATVVTVQTPTGQSAINLGVGQDQLFEAIITGQQNENAIWYVCTKSNNCILNGNSALGTVSPTTPTDAVTYTAPPVIPSPATLILKAVSQADPSVSGQATITIVQQQVVTVQVIPSQPQSVQVGDSIDGFQAVVNGSPDQNVTWYVCNTVNPPTCFPYGNTTYGTMSQDPNFPNEEDYLAPLSVPNPATVDIEAVPEADPSVVSNAVPVTILPSGQQETVTVNLQYPVILPNQADMVSANVVPGPDQTVNWTLSLPASEGGGSCTSLPLICGSIVPLQTDNVPATYTPPSAPPNDPWYVEITATSNAYPGASATVQVEITKEATTSISISPNPPPPIQAGSGGFISFTVNIVNGQQDQNTDWTLGCSSEAQNGLWCGSPFGTGAWTGCIEGADGQKQCSSGALDEPGNTALTYTPPPKTGNSFQPNACVSQPGGPDMIPLSASISTQTNNCSVDSCTAVACITILPAGAK